MQSLRIAEINKSFGLTQALAAVSCEIAAGKRLVVCGGSGAGKTTLLRIIAGLEAPDSGKIQIGERDMTNIAAHERGVALLSQDYAVYPQLTVAKNLQVALESLRLSRAEADSRVEETLQWFRLSDLCSRRPAQLSGGQLQRVAFAKAIVRRPQVLVLDEPFSQLDPILREASRQLIQTTTAKFNMTLVMVTHDPLDALRLADEIAVLQNGRLAQFGDPTTIYHSPASQYVAELISPIGVNELWLESKRVLFRPESATLLDESDRVSDATSSDVRCSGVLQQVQSLGFAQLAFVAIAAPSDLPRSPRALQVVKILTAAAKKLPTVGSQVSFRIDQPLESLSDH